MKKLGKVGLYRGKSIMKMLKKLLAMLTISISILLGLTNVYALSNDDQGINYLNKDNDILLIQDRAKP